jgi:hypothetical protein
MVVHQRHPQGTEGRRKAQKATVKKAPTKKKMSAARESSVTGKFGKSKGSPGGEESGSVIQQSWMDTICDSAASGSVITPLAGFAVHAPTCLARGREEPVSQTRGGALLKAGDRNLPSGDPATDARA